MYVVMTIIILITCILLMLIVLIQNPKGGGLTASLGSIGNQMMGAQKTTDVLEKATWGLAIALLIFSLAGSAMIETETADTSGVSEIENAINDGYMAPSNNPTNQIPIPEKPIGEQ